MISNFSLKKRDIDISYSSNSTFSYDKEKILRTFQNPALFLSSTFFLVFVIISVLSWFDFVFETYFLNKSNLLSSFKNVHELCYLHRYTEVRYPPPNLAFATFSFRFVWFWDFELPLKKVRFMLSFSLGPIGLYSFMFFFNFKSWIWVTRVLKKCLKVWIFHTNILIMFNIPNNIYFSWSIAWLYIESIENKT